MRMYDELRCEYPLPDGFVCPDGCLFQTKDTPEQSLSLYVLTCDGRLRHEKTGELESFHGALRFYTTNMVSFHGTQCMTYDDTAPWRAEYCALFDHGKLLKLEGQRMIETTMQHVSREAFYKE